MTVVIFCWTAILQSIDMALHLKQNFIACIYCHIKSGYEVFPTIHTHAFNTRTTFRGQKDSNYRKSI